MFDRKVKKKFMKEGTHVVNLEKENILKKFTILIFILYSI